MIQVCSQWVEAAGRRKVKVTLRDGEKVVDADLIDPYQASARLKAVQRLAERGRAGGGRTH